MTSPRLPLLATWGLVAAPLLMGAALVLSGWATFQNVEDASETLTRGQSLLLERSLRGTMMELRRLPTDADLAEVLPDLEEHGLKYIGVFGEDGLIARAGEALGAGMSRPGELVPVGDRLREVVPTRRRAPRFLREGDPPMRRPLIMVIEFEPRQARELRSAAMRTFGIGAVSAVLLLLAALALVRMILARQAQERRREQERQLARLGQMSAVLAHEIRNPLASLKGNAQLLAMSLPEGDKPRAKAQRLVDESIRLETLTNELLEFARTGELHRTDADPAALLGDAAGAVSGDIALDVAGAPPSWSLDGPRMRQVLVNLLENAVTAGPPVRARVAVEGRALVFEITDGGAGIPAEDLEKIFEPFYTRRVRGTGLGLAVAEHVVRLHGGTIRADNHPEGGARFVVTLPR